MRKIGSALTGALENAVAGVLIEDRLKLNARRRDQVAALQALAKAANGLLKAWDNMPPDARAFVRLLSQSRGDKDAAHTLEAVKILGSVARSQSTSMRNQSKGREPNTRAQSLARSYMAAFGASRGVELPQSDDHPGIQALQYGLWAIESKANPRSLVAGLQKEK